MKPGSIFICILLGSIGHAQDFDINRAVLFDSAVLHPFKVESKVKLSLALRAGLVTETERILIAEFPGNRIAFLYHQMAYHHVAFGDDTRPWMVSFCIACNSGAGFYTQIGGLTYHFEGAGIYDGMILLKDHETGSYWSHITGECLYGDSTGRTLPSLNLLHSTVKAALLKSDDVDLAVSDMAAYSTNPFYQLTLKTLPTYSPDPNNQDQADLGKQFKKTIGKQDTRLHTMTLGLGVWSGDRYRFYPSKAIDSANVILEDFGNKRVVVLNNDVSGIPFAFFTDAYGFTTKGNRTYLDNGLIITEKGIQNKHGMRFNPEMPMQMFTRWYGFALTFPATTIYPSY